MDDLSFVVPKPAHVPDAAVFKFDMYLDAGLVKNPHQRILELQQEAPPVFWTPHNGGHWMVIGHNEVFEAQRDWQKFSSKFDTPERVAEIQAAIPPGGRRAVEQTPITLDPPEHTKYRLPLNSVFSPKSMATLTGSIRELTDSLIDDVIEDGHCDFTASVAEPLPVKIFLKLMGLPLERLAEFRRMVHEFLAPGLNLPSESYRRNRMIADAMRDDILERKERPQNDLISLLWATEIEGEPMTYDLMEDYCCLLFVAGLDTVINAMGFGIRHLAIDQATQANLRANPDMITEAVEEILRRYSIVASVRRIAQDMEFGGWEMKQGEWMMVYAPAGNLDPSRFEAPGTVDIARENKAHLGFGSGQHRCLGSNLARLELRILYERALARLPPFRLDPDRPAKFRCGNVIAVESLPIRWD
jgi:cytochrome P450